MQYQTCFRSFQLTWSNVLSSEKSLLTSHSSRSYRTADLTKYTVVKVNFLLATSKKTFSNLKSECLLVLFCYSGTRTHTDVLTFQQKNASTFDTMPSFFFFSFTWNPIFVCRSNRGEFHKTFSFFVVKREIERESEMELMNFYGP